MILVQQIPKRRIISPKIDVSWYTELFMVSGSIKKPLSINRVNIYFPQLIVLSIFFSVDVWYDFGMVDLCTK